MWSNLWLYHKIFQKCLFFHYNLLHRFAENIEISTHFFWDHLLLQLSFPLKRALWCDWAHKRGRLLVKLTNLWCYPVYVFSRHLLFQLHFIGILAKCSNPYNSMLAVCAAVKCTRAFYVHVHCAHTLNAVIFFGKCLIVDTNKRQAGIALDKWLSWKSVN